MRNTVVPEGGFAEVNGASLYYDVTGNGEPLVLVHAGIADRRHEGLRPL